MKTKLKTMAEVLLGYFSIIFSGNHSFHHSVAREVVVSCRKKIQEGDKGHNPIEDALYSMKLVNLKLEKGENILE